ncbi:hypothetical protein OH492_04445 [Vibrio chagasii]|nr:hypothetical protein [Vibrio chagasii]
MPELSKTAGDKLEAAAIAVDRNTGEIRAMWSVASVLAMTA